MFLLSTACVPQSSTDLSQTGTDSATTDTTTNGTTDQTTPTTDTTSTSSYYAGQVFPADNPWNQDISQAAVDPNSSTYINSLGANGNLHPDFGTVWNGAPNGQPYIVVSGNQARVPVTFDYVAESDPGPYPIPANAPIQGGPNGTGDRHVIVIDKDHQLLYEMYLAYPNSDGSWRATSGAVFDLNSNSLRPIGWTSADAAGLPIFPGLARYEEVVEKKEITHALRFTGNVGAIRNAYVYPARHTDGTSNNSSLPPMGARFRLKANFDISTYPASAQVILRALKKYGMILADTGVSWMISGVPNSKWKDQELLTLEKIPGSAFEVVKTGAISN